jgi:ppGpp synthetase/RelA/SpoT-type nucleotidyltranferase
MPLPMSKSALDRLGNKLATGTDVPDEDLDQLAEVVRAYQVLLDELKAQVVGLGFEPTTRVKTTRSLIDKLRREHGMRLSRIQDLAGARILVPGRSEQDQARDKICTYFAAAGCHYRVIDRRENPSYGYRAVHVIVQANGVPVEIQIRTEMQDLWAQIVERLGDRWGRGLRYGQGPDDPDYGFMAHGFGTFFTRQNILNMLMHMSDGISKAEEWREFFPAEVTDWLAGRPRGLLPPLEELAYRQPGDSARTLRQQRRLLKEVGAGLSAIEELNKIFRKLEQDLLGDLRSFAQLTQEEDDWW